MTQAAAPRRGAAASFVDGRARELSQARTLRREYCAAGVDVTWGTYLGEHVTTLAVSAGDVVNYLGDRFAGKPARSSC